MRFRKRGLAESTKTLVEIANELASVTYKLAGATGAIITAFYLFSIDFFPQGLSPGEVIFFVFVAFAFGVLYLLLLLYGAYSSIWIGKVLTLFLGLCRFRSTRPMGTESWQKIRRVIAERRKNPGCGCAWFRSFRRAATRWSRQRKSLIPRAISTWDQAVGSFLVFLVFLLFFFDADDKRAVSFIGIFMVGGFFTLMFFSNNQSSKLSPRVRFTGAVLFPFIFILVFAKPTPLLHAAFRMLGIRAEHVSLEVPYSELSTFEHLGDFLERPIVDCRRTSGNKILLHDATVLWSEIGSQALVEFSSPVERVKGWFAQQPDPAKTLRTTLDTSSMRIIKAKPSIDPCFDLSTDMLFESGKYKLKPLAKEKIEQAAKAINSLGKPTELFVRGHTDPRPVLKGHIQGVDDNQRLSECRANAVAYELKNALNVEGVLIHPEGVSSREPKVKCANEAAATKYELEQCNKANRRVEVQMKFGSPSTSKGKSGKSDEIQECL